jgi:Holliday junction resolvasome RuvABC endonuclease subunit
MTYPRVLGLDLSLTGTGIAHIDGSTCTVRTRGKDGDRRLIQIQDAVRAACAPGVDLAVIEGLPTHGAYMIGTLGVVHGAVRVVLAILGIPYVYIPVTTLKAYATGKGGADKAKMAAAALGATGLMFADDNQCDAWWLRMAGLDRLGHAEVVLPAAQRARLGAVKKWPDVRPVVAAA